LEFFIIPAVSISYNSITTCVGNVQVSEENTSENGSVYKVSGEYDIPVGEYLYIRDPNGYRICIYELFVP
jgi:hypothetical protein